MNKIEAIRNEFEKHQNKENAITMSNYMRNQFIFYGIPTVERRKIYRDFLKNEKKNKIIDWEFLQNCYKEEHREFQYFVYDYLLEMNDYVLFEDLGKIKEFVIQRPWWDTIDFLCKVIGSVGLRDTRVKNEMILWSKSQNIWVKRTAIEHQLCLKDKTDVALLEEILINSLGTTEFFINKAIGWSLRDFSKTNPSWVKQFIEAHQNELSNLSIREGSKYL